MTENTHGGARNGAGRPSKSDEIKIAEQMDAIMMPDHVWAALSMKVIEQDVQAIKTWLGYRFGMPKQTVENNNLNISFADLSPEDRLKRIEELKLKLNDK